MRSITNLLEDYILYELLAISWILCLWNLYLTLRQRKLVKQLVDVPKSVEGLMSKDVYDKARLYSLDKSTFTIAKDLYGICWTTVCLLAYAMWYYWHWSIQLGEKLGISSDNDILISAVCMFLVNTITYVIDLPFQIIHTFILEEKYGFNKQKPLFFIKDQVLKFIVLHVIVLPILCCVIWIIKNGGDYFILYVWIFIVIVQLFLMILYPEIIAPLFDKYSPLPEGELKQKIEELAASVKFPLYKLFIVEGSKRSSHSNAYLYGFYKHKRIVLFDTLVKEYYKPDQNDENKDQGCQTNEILAVLAHELGHWKYSHTIKSCFLVQVIFIINFISFAKLIHYTPMYVAFGFTDSQPIFIGLTIVVTYVLLPLDVIIHVASVVMGRRFEFQADKFAVSLGHSEPLKGALIKLQKDNLGYPLYDKLYSSWYHSHPPLLERLEAIDKEA